MRIWIDNSGLGENGSWYLLSVTVMDVQTGHTNRFIADRWLAVDRGDFQDDITIHAIDEDDEKDKYYLMKSSANKSLLDKHIWWSVFTRPLRSRFGRAQRVSVCFAMLVILMVANAMFYGTLPPRASKGLFGLGMLSFDPVDVSDLPLDSKPSISIDLLSDWPRRLYKFTDLSNHLDPGLPFH